jgi:hypothetical protein
MTAQLSLSLGDNSEQAPNLETFDKETNKAERDESAVDQNQDELAVEQEADPRGPQVNILEQDLGAADQDASVLAQAVSRDNQGAGTWNQQ